MRDHLMGYQPAAQEAARAADVAEYDDGEDWLELGPQQFPLGVPNRVRRAQHEVICELSQQIAEKRRSLTAFEKSNHPLPDGSYHDQFAEDRAKRRSAKQAGPASVPYDGCTHGPIHRVERAAGPYDTAVRVGGPVVASPFVTSGYFRCLTGDELAERRERERALVMNAADRIAAHFATPHARQLAATLAANPQAELHAQGMPTEQVIAF